LIDLGFFFLAEFCPFAFTFHQNGENYIYLSSIFFSKWRKLYLSVFYFFFKMAIDQIRSL
jgi:hypothetical protein